MNARPSYHGDSPDGSGPEFQQLVDLHYAGLYRFAVSLTRTEIDAVDLVQETFLSWGAKGHQLKDATKAKSWLFTTLHRHFLERHRRHAKFPHVELSDASDELPNIEPNVINQMDAREVVRLLQSVDPQYHAAVALFYLEDYSYNEVAEILEIPLGTVKSRIARGLAQLKQLVRDATAPSAAQEEKL